jgi:ectoine hydroxylase-related dioxygenase (phytanoyl-CoA dioxygenase family)
VTATEELSVLDREYPITDEQLTSLHQDSWAWLPGLLDADTVAKIAGVLGAVDPSEIISGPAEIKTESSTLEIHEGVSWDNPYLRDVVTSKRLSSAVTALTRQPDALVTHDISFFQHVGSPGTPFHQDYSYQPFDRKGSLTFWIALGDLAPEMGPLRYLRGSHLEGPLGLIEARDIRDAYPHLRESEIVGGQAMKAGDAQAHWDLTLHGARPNEGPRRRDALAVRYMRTDTIYTGLTHPHWNRFDLKPGTRFADSGKFPLVGPDGLI